MRLGIRYQGSGIRDQGLGNRGTGCEDWGAECRGQVRGQGSRIRDQGSGIIGIGCIGIRVQGAAYADYDTACRGGGEATALVCCPRHSM